MSTHIVRSRSRRGQGTAEGVVKTLSRTWGDEGKGKGGCAKNAVSRLRRGRERGRCKGQGTAVRV
jgi:hypothetical protein